MSTAESKPATNFIRDIIDHDLAAGRRQAVVTRFPPEPNGYLHVGHAKSICLNFGLARDYSNAPSGGRCHLRFDDTNPTKEEQEYIDAIKADVRWLGFDWGEHEYYASDYFDQLYEWAIVLIRKGVAYVCDLSAEQVSVMRGTPAIPATASPNRNRSVEENLDLFARMKAGEFPNGSRTLRAKIDLASPNFNLRDPVMYRIMHHDHPRTGGKWRIYPMYDWAHGQSDWIEGITHSLCTLEFEDHRPLYEWFIRQLREAGVDPRTLRNDLVGGAVRAASEAIPGAGPPRQIEFARLNLTYTMMSKRRLLKLVEDGLVNGWDDPRMPTLSGMRRRGYPPEALRDFAEGVGVAKREHVIELSRLEFHIREHLNKTAQRRMAVLRPLKLVITNYPADQVEQFDVVNNPEDESAGTRQVPFSRELWIEQDDFMETPPAGTKFFRLSPGKEVRLRSAYWVKAESVVKDAVGRITEVHGTYDPQTRGGANPPDGRKVKATIHWVSAEHAVDAEVRLYDKLFVTEDPNEAAEDAAGRAWLDNLNRDALEIVAAKCEPSLADAVPGAGERYQFERLAYFACDPDSTPGKPVFNRTVTLKDTWAKEQKRA